MKTLFLRRVKGKSMLPAFGDGKIVVASGLLPVKTKSVVVARWNRKEIIKRVISIDSDSVRLAGDNLGDSLKVKVQRSDILGVVL